jgi:hypothetical protein
VWVFLQIGNKERELEALQTRNEYLEAVLRDAVVRFRKKEEDLQVMAYHRLSTHTFVLQF